MSLLRALYLALAVLGALPAVGVLTGLWAGVPNWLYPGFTVVRADGLTWDFLVASLAITIWASAEVYVRKNWIGLVALPVTWIVGVGCGLPLYLFLRTAPPR